MLFGKEHVRRYQQTDGAEGYVWANGTTIQSSANGTLWAYRTICARAIPSIMTKTPQTIAA